MFPSPGILQNYVDFDIHTIGMLEKLVGAGFFNGSISHLTHCQAIFPTFSNELSFIFMVQTTTPTFLGCWALIVPTIATSFQQGDYPILLNAVAHVDTD